MVKGKAIVANSETRFHGVRKRPWGRFVVEIRDLSRRSASGSTPLTQPRKPLEPTTLPSYRGNKAKTNFPLPSSPQVHVRLYETEGFLQHQRPTTSGMSSTIESFNGPRASNPWLIARKSVSVPAVVREDEGDCGSDCDSSSSVIDYCEGDADVSCSKVLPFDFNFPPADDVDDLVATALRL